MTPVAPVGYLAGGLVFATFCTKHMVQLRALAIASNIAFIGYGYLGKLWPILILHAAMLPINTHTVSGRKSSGRRPLRRRAPTTTNQWYRRALPPSRRKDEHLQVEKLSRVRFVSACNARITWNRLSPVVRCGLAA